TRPGAPAQVFHVKQKEARRTLQPVKKVPSSRHVRMDGTHTGKFGAESVRGRKAECAVQCQILSPGGYQGEGISVLRSRQKWVPPGACRFCDMLRGPAGLRVCRPSRWGCGRCIRCIRPLPPGGRW